jgi:Fe-S-cluster containining protein
VITDLVQIRRLGEKKKAENESFRKYLKRHEWVERQFRRAAQDIEDQIDCRQCAECCRVTECEITTSDVQRLAKFLGIKPSAFVEQYTMKGSDDEMILKRTDKDGCVFLEGNDCSIYEERPTTCKGFPHLLKGAGSIQAKMWAFVDRATYCPIVYNWMETVKGFTKFTK